jgi:hypothetical protein
MSKEINNPVEANSFHMYLLQISSTFSSLKAILAMAFVTVTVKQNERNHFTVYNMPHYLYFGNPCH